MLRYLLLLQDADSAREFLKRRQDKMTENLRQMQEELREKADSLNGEWFWGQTVAGLLHCVVNAPRISAIPPSC